MRVRTFMCSSANISAYVQNVVVISFFRHLFGTLYSLLIVVVFLPFLYMYLFKFTIVQGAAIKPTTFYSAVSTMPVKIERR